MEAVDTAHVLTTLGFDDALQYSGDASLTTSIKVKMFNNAMQYIRVPDRMDGSSFATVSNAEAAMRAYSLVRSATRADYIAAAKRCALVSALYEVTSSGSSVAELAFTALASGDFDDLIFPSPFHDESEVCEPPTWCVRARKYGHSSDIEDSHHAGRIRRSGQDCRNRDCT
jgi:hypothetical protein